VELLRRLFKNTQVRQQIFSTEATLDDRLTRAARARNTSAMQNSPDDRAGTCETPNEAIYGRPVATLGIKVVVEMPAVLYVIAREVVSQLEDYVLKIRHNSLKVARGKPSASDIPWYRCLECESPLLVAAIKCRDDSGHLYYFKHPINSPDCLQKRHEGDLTREEINAARYKGLSEGSRHLRLKRLLLMSAAADPALKGIELQARWVSAEKIDRYRIPDVSFTAPACRVAMEAQVSNTSLQDMQARQAFYQSEQAVLIWVVDVPPIGDIRMYLKDVREIHHGNLFLVDEDSALASVERSELMLWCYYDEPVLENGNIEERYSHRLIPFSALTISPTSGEAWFFDRRAAISGIEESLRFVQRRDFVVRQTFFSPPAADPYADCRLEYFEGVAIENLEARHLLVDYVFDFWNGSMDSFALRERSKYVCDRMHAAGAEMPSFGSRDYYPFSMRLAILLSARFRRCVYYNLPTLVALAHHTVAKYPDVYWYFRHICKQYGADEVIKAEDVTGNWEAKESSLALQRAQAKRSRQKRAFTTDLGWLPLCHILFPEVVVFRPKPPADATD